MNNQLTIFVFLLLLGACTGKRAAPENPDDIDPSTQLFFSKGVMNDYFKDSSFITAPSISFNRIKKSIPKHGWRYAVEGLYYNLPEQLDTGMTEKWLDTAQLILPDQNVLSFLQLIRGIRLAERGAYSESITYLQNSYDLAVLKHQMIRANDARRYMGRSYMLNGEYPSAIALLTQSFEFLRNKPDSLHEVRKFETMLDIAKVYQYSGDFKMALQWGKKILAYIPQSHHGQKVIATENVAQTFLNLHQPDSALTLLKVAEMIRYTYKIQHDSANGNFLMGKTLIALNQCKEALQWLKRAESGNLEPTNRLKISKIKESIGDSYACIGGLDPALAYYQQALRITPDTSAIADIHYKISDIYALQGNFQNALVFNKTGTKYYKRFYAADKAIAIGRIESKLALERKNNQVIRLTAHQKTQQYKTELLSLVFLLLSSFLFFGYDRQRRKRRILNKENELLKAQEIIQKQALQLAKLSLSKKEAELTSLEQLVELKNNLISSLEEKIYTLSPSAEGETPLRMLTKSDWNIFCAEFEQQFPGYLSRLKSQFPRITETEIRSFIFIKIGLENAKIANICGISLDSVYRNRNRLRQRLKLDNSLSLEKFVEQF